MAMRRYPDDLSDEPRLEGLVKLARESRAFGDQDYETVRARLLAGYADACCKVAKSMTNGFVSRATLLRYMAPSVVDALCQRLSDEETGMLHVPGDICDCLDGRPWPPYIEYAVHNFLKTNPTKAERDLSDQKKRERRA